MSLYPVFLKLQDRRVLLVGAGKVAASKLAGLHAAGADVVVVALDVHPSIATSGVVLHRRAFRASDLDGAFFVVAAAPPEVNRTVLAESEKRGLFVNAVDDLASATAYLGGVVRKGGVTVALSTEGEAPALAGLLREALERLLPDDLSDWMVLAQRLRADWKREGVPMGARRSLLLQALLSKYTPSEAQ